MELSFNLTPLQQGMLLQSIDREARDCYVIQTVFAWSEAISLTEFEKAWGVLASRHEILRSSFRWKDTPEPKQVVSANPMVAFSINRIPSHGPESNQPAIQEFLDADLRRGIPTFDSPPWRVTALVDQDGSVTAVWTFHHILLDGRSHILMLRELLEIYDGLMAGNTVQTVQEVPHSQHSRWLERQDFSHAKEFWSEYLRSATLPTDFPKPNKPVSRLLPYAFYESSFGPELTLELRKFSASSGISVGSIVQTSWALVLGWLANQSDVVVGAVRACRKSGIEDGGNLMGVMINTVPLRVKWEPDSRIQSVLQEVSRDWRAFRNYEHTPLRNVRRSAGLPAHTQLFSAAVSYSSAHYSEAVVPVEADRIRRRLWMRQTTPYCSADVSAGRDDIFISVNVPEALVEPDIARQCPQFLKNTIQGIVSNANGRVRNLSPLDPAERRNLIFATNTRWEPPPARIDWIDKITEFTRRNPDWTALESAGEQVSWRALEQRSNHVAYTLRERGMQPGELIAVFLPRSVEFIWTCLGILKAGAAYLPLDVNYPRQRIATVLADAKPFSTLTNDAFRPLLPDDDKPYWTTPLESSDGKSLANRYLALAPESLAYVIYTSGSSGVPKGVEITHAGLQNLIGDTIATFSLDKKDRGCFLSNTAFDASVHETWPLLAVGARLCLPPPENLQNPTALLNWMAAHHISFAFVSVIMAEALTRMAAGRSLSLRYLLTGGDQLRLRPSDDLPFELINEYGPTEYSVVATRYPVARLAEPGASLASASIPIGKPLRGTRAYVMNSCQQLLPRGVPGELVLAGNGSARGYRNQTELTAQKFVQNSILEETSTTLYRTGDLVRWMEDGNLQFLGRLDSQVKLRGFRIELGEIEESLLKHPQVSEAVVIYKADPEPRLVAFLVSKTDDSAGAGDLAPLLTEQLTGHLRNLLPDYMLPSQFVVQPVLPVNRNGKYDRKQLAALLLPQAQRHARGPAVFHSPVEEKVAAIWQEILEVPSVQPDDRFLSLGGTSLSIINLLCAIDLNFGAEIPVAEVLNDPTPGELATLIQSNGARSPRPVVRLRGSGREHPLFCIPGAGGGIHWFRDLASAMAPDRTIFGLELLALSEETKANFSVETAAGEIAQLVAASIDDSACSLCGYSGGGLLALEAAQRLQASGVRVDNVFLLDTYPPPRSNGLPAKVTRWLRGWWSLPREQRWAALASRLTWLGQARRQALSPLTGIEKELLAIKQQHIQAFSRYLIRPYAGRTSLFFSQDRPISVRAAIHHDWSRHLTGDFTITILRGDHYSLLRKENAEVLARYLSDSPVVEQRAGEPAMRNEIVFPNA